MVPLCDAICRGDVRTRSRENSAVSTERRDDRSVAERGVTDDGWCQKDDRGCQICQVTDRSHLPDRKSDTLTQLETWFRRRTCFHVSPATAWLAKEQNWGGGGRERSEPDTTNNLN